MRRQGQRSAAGERKWVADMTQSGAVVAAPNRGRATQDNTNSDGATSQGVRRWGRGNEVEVIKRE